MPHFRHLESVNFVQSYSPILQSMFIKFPIAPHPTGDYYLLDTDV